jgi:hypothetical protein
MLDAKEAYQAISVQTQRLENDRLKTRDRRIRTVRMLPSAMHTNALNQQTVSTVIFKWFSAS